MSRTWVDPIALATYRSMGQCEWQGIRLKLKRDTWYTGTRISWYASKMRYIHVSTFSRVVEVPVAMVLLIVL